MLQTFYKQHIFNRSRRTRTYFTDSNNFTLVVVSVCNNEKPIPKGESKEESEPMKKSLNGNLKTKKKVQGHLRNYKKLLSAQAII